MNPYIHSEISVKHWGGNIEDYFDIHSFIDSSKEVESTNKHRLLTHHLWFIRNVMVPIFGARITNSDGRSVDVKDLLESDHVLADYRQKFIPTLSDFFASVSDDENDHLIIEKFYKENREIESIPLIQNLLLSPLWNTGKVKSLLLTHNSWFIGEILPRLFPKLKLNIKNFSISPDLLFSRTKYEKWMTNGEDFTPSFNKKAKTKEIFYDGSKLNNPDAIEQPSILVKPSKPALPSLPQILD